MGISAHQHPWQIRPLALLILVCALLATGSAASSVVRIGFIGDSITANTVSGWTPADVAADELARHGYTVRIVNRAVRGTRSIDWLPQTDRFRQALAAFHHADVSLVQVVLGTNDAMRRWRISPARFLDAMRAICAALQAAGFQVVLAYPPAARPYVHLGTGAVDTTADIYLMAYQESVRTLVQEEWAVLGDTAAYPFFRDHPNLLRDGIHPTAQGVRILGMLWADAFHRMLYAHGGGLNPAAGRRRDDPLPGLKARGFWWDASDLAGLKARGFLCESIPPP